MLLTYGDKVQAVRPAAVDQLSPILRHSHVQHRPANISRLRSKYVHTIYFLHYPVEYYLDCLQQFESILPGVVKSNFVWAGCDEEVSIPGMGPTKYFLVVIFKLQ